VISENVKGLQSWSAFGDAGGFVRPICKHTRHE